MQNMFEKQKSRRPGTEQLKLEADYKAAASKEETLAKYLEIKFSCFR